MELNISFLNNQWIKEITREFSKFIEMNENENKTYQNLWDTGKAVLKGRFIAVNAYIREILNQ